MEPITAQEAKEAVEKLIFESFDIKRFFDCVKESIVKKERSFNFYMGADGFTKEELDYVESLGYTLWWDDCMARYEVSF